MATTLGIIPTLLDHKAESVPATLFSQDDALDGLLGPDSQNVSNLKSEIFLSNLSFFSQI